MLRTKAHSLAMIILIKRVADYINLSDFVYKLELLCISVTRVQRTQVQIDVKSHDGFKTQILKYLLITLIT